MAGADAYGREAFTCWRSSNVLAPAIERTVRPQPADMSQTAHDVGELLACRRWRSRQQAPAERRSIFAESAGMREPGTDYRELLACRRRRSLQQASAERRSIFAKPADVEETGAYGREALALRRRSQVIGIAAPADRRPVQTESANL